MNLPMAPSPTVPQALTADEISVLTSEVRALAAERNAVILAHNYQVPEVQDAADYVGDSLGLSRRAADVDADVIAFCGVHFMAETASILSPQKTVLIPDLDAGCSLADTITLRHVARSREGFALGALKAAGWVQNRKGVFTFDDVLFGHAQPDLE